MGLGSREHDALVHGVLERWAIAIVESAARWMWGFPPRLMAVMVRRMRPLPALAWFAWNMPRYERTLARFGAVRTHLLGMAISLVNGCRYCVYGHGYALELAYLRDQGKLFPLNENELLDLCGKPPVLIRRRLREAVQHAGLHSDMPWLDRAIELTLQPDPRPTDRDDMRIAHLVRMFGVANAISIADNTEPDEALDPVNKDAALKSRYAALRIAASA